MTENQQQPHAFEGEIAAFETLDRQSFPRPGQILFVGSSTFNLWPSLEKDFAPLAILKRGFGGSQYSDLLHFMDRIVIPYRPGTIVVYEGDNDIACGRSPRQLLEDFQTFVARARKALGPVKIIVVSTKPSPNRMSLWGKTQEANHLIASFTASQKDVIYVDTASCMLDEDGNARPELYSDGVHMTPAGYQLWTKILRPVLEANR